MLLYKPTNRIFQNRAEAKKELGANRYKNAVRYKEIEYVIATYEELQEDNRESGR